MRRRITEEKIRNYEKFLYEDEKAPATVKKYICDIGKLSEYAGDSEITKVLVREYKEHLMEIKNIKTGASILFWLPLTLFLNIWDGKMQLAMILQTIAAAGSRWTAVIYGGR